MFFADLHIHSKFSRATGKDADLEHMALWARKKGVTVVGTGDFMHPQWMKELREKLIPAESGLFRLRDDLERAVGQAFQPAPNAPSALSAQTEPSAIAGQAGKPDVLLQGVVRFLLEVEISTIYKKGDRTRKVHHLVYVPDFEAAEKLIGRLSRIGNLASDGRPILGLDSRHLLEITLESSTHSYLVPAHIWTPWFAALGSKSGFDSITDCYGDLTPHIFALETGLSSDPPMNWRLSQLDRFTLVSNSDAHSPPKIGREACAFACDLSYFAMKQALETRDGYAGTVEFFPEEGKYHLDGHRACGVRLTPEETRERDGLCPNCGKQLTVGVLSRVDELADRPEGVARDEQPEHRNLVPLPEVIGEIKGMGESSKAVQAAYDQTLAKVGSELFILNEAPVEDLRKLGSPLLADAIERIRAGQVIRDAGYDGEYGVIRVFEPGELASRGTKSLFEVEVSKVQSRESRVESKASTASRKPMLERLPTDVERPTPSAESNGKAPETLDSGRATLDPLDPDQRAAASHTRGPLLIIAGPGTGKTRTLTHRVAHLIFNERIPPEQCLTVTFSRRAANELEQRLAVLLPESSRRVPVMTFHALGLLILQEHADLCGVPANFRIATEAERVKLLQDAFNATQRLALASLRMISGFKRSRSDGQPPKDDSQTLAFDGLSLPVVFSFGDAPLCDPEEFSVYERLMRTQSWLDFDDLIRLPTRLLTERSHLAAELQARWPFVSVDEFQDIDAGQYALLKQLAPSDSNLCVIGDPDQAIYGFRGSDPRIFQQFVTDFPTVQTVLLRRNYRSSATIVSAALQAIRPSSFLPDRELESVLDLTERVSVQSCPTDKSEAEFVVHTIERLLGGSSHFSLDSGRVDREEGQAWSFNDFAVLYRTEAQAGVIEDALQQSGLPFQRQSHAPLTDMPAVQAIHRWLQENLVPAAVSASTPEVTASVTELLKRAADAVWSEHPDAATLLSQLHPLAAGCGDDLPRFLKELALATNADLWDVRADRVSLLTLHAAKGLEFGVVFLVGCEDGVLPLTFGPLAAGTLDEERRLFFVGLTRARSRLFLSHAKRRMWRGRLVYFPTSPFLAEIEECLLSRGESAARRSAQPLELQRSLFD